MEKDNGDLRIYYGMNQISFNNDFAATHLRHDCCVVWIRGDLDREFYRRLFPHMKHGLGRCLKDRQV